MDAGTSPPNGLGAPSNTGSKSAPWTTGIGELLLGLGAGLPQLGCGSGASRVTVALATGAIVASEEGGKAATAAVGAAISEAAGRGMATSTRSSVMDLTAVSVKGSVSSTCGAPAFIAPGASPTARSRVSDIASHGAAVGGSPGLRTRTTDAVTVDWIGGAAIGAVVDWAGGALGRWRIAACGVDGARLPILDGGGGGGGVACRGGIGGPLVAAVEVTFAPRA